MKLSFSRAASRGALILLVFSLAGCGGAPLAPAGGTNYEAYPTLDEDTGSTAPLDVVGSGCTANNANVGDDALQVMASQPAAAAVSSDPELSTFSSLINQNGLGDYLNYSQSAVTVFAPDNQAFTNLHNELGAQRYAALVNQQNSFADLLKSLMVTERDTRDVLLKAGTVHTLGHTALRLNSGPSNTTVVGAGGQQARIVCGNIPTQNAILHVIDNVVIQPPVPGSPNQSGVGMASR